MTFNPNLHHRRSIRLQGYDYSQAGAYFITICTHDRVPLFGEIVDGVTMLNAAGNIMNEEWHKTGQIRHQIVLHEFVIMPNHVHGIIQRAPTVGMLFMGLNCRLTNGLMQNFLRTP